MSNGDPWAHDEAVCGTLECPGCWADTYQPRDNAQRTEDVDDGHPRSDGRSFYTEDGI